MDLRQLFHLPLTEAAKYCQTGTTHFKKLCRAQGIKRWPYRRYKTLQTTSSMLARMNTLQADAEEAKQASSGLAFASHLLNSCFQFTSDAPQEWVLQKVEIVLIDLRKCISLEDSRCLQCSPIPSPSCSYFECITVLSWYLCLVQLWLNEMEEAATLLAEDLGALVAAENFRRLRQALFRMEYAQRCINL